MNPDSTSYPAQIPEVLRAPALTVGKVTPRSLDDQVLCYPGQAPPLASWRPTPLTRCMAWSVRWGNGFKPGVALYAPAQWQELRGALNRGIKEAAQ